MNMKIIKHFEVFPHFRDVPSCNQANIYCALNDAVIQINIEH